MVNTRFNAEQRHRRHLRVRRSVSGTPERPRLCVYRSLKSIYVQIIDDTTAKTLLAAGTNSPELKGAKVKKTDAARAVGKLIADKAKAAGITMVCFDRAGYKFHGRVKALAEAAREAGLKF
jgi:large subunit ribosomal protein L18